jgi:hypothetical protein
LFIILQQNLDTVKVENDVDVKSEEDLNDMEADKIYISSSFAIKKAESEVSLVFRRILYLLFM